MAPTVGRGSAVWDWRDPERAAGAGNHVRSTWSDPITLRRPRVWGLEARFASQVLPLFKQRTEEGRQPAQAEKTE